MQKQKEEDLLSRIADLRGKYDLSHVREHVCADVPSLKAELALVLAAVCAFCLYIHWQVGPLK